MKNSLLNLPERSQFKKVIVKFLPLCEEDTETFQEDSVALWDFQEHSETFLPHQDGSVALRAFQKVSEILWNFKS